MNLLFYNEIDSYKLIGEPTLNEATRTLLSDKNQNDQPDLVVIYKSHSQMIEYYWQNTLQYTTKWLVIVPKNLEEATIIFKLIRSFGDSILIKYPTPIIIIKNIKPDFKQHYRSDILKNIPEPNIQEFLNIPQSKISLEDCEQINGNEETLIVKSIASQYLYAYFGKPISNEQLRNIKELTKFSARIIQCVDPNTNETYGYFSQNDYIQQCWLMHLAKYDLIKDVLNIRRIFIEAPIFRI